jgi:hypothetical protein
MIKIEITEDRMGCLILQPVNQRIQRQLERHNSECAGHSENTVLIQTDTSEFMERLSDRQRSSISEGYRTVVLMDPYEFGCMVGYDFHEVINGSNAPAR